MGTRGRKSLQDLEVPGSEDKKLDKRVKPPDYMTEDQCKIWVSITNSLPVGYFSPADEPLLAAYCIAYSNFKEANNSLRTDGLALTDQKKGRLYANPAAVIISSQSAAMSQLATKLRLCPSSRYGARSAFGAAANPGRGSKGAKGASSGSKPWEFTDANQDPDEDQD